MVTRQGSVPAKTGRAIGAPLLVAAVHDVVCAAIWVGDPTTPNGPLPTCPTKALLGIDCPGCGSLRMLYSLMHGNLLAAARFNALGLVAVGALGVGLPGVDLWPRGGPADQELAAQSLGRRGDSVAGGGWFVVRNLPFRPIRRAVRLSVMRKPHPLARMRLPRLWGARSSLGAMVHKSKTIPAVLAVLAIVAFITVGLRTWCNTRPRSGGGGQSASRVRQHDPQQGHHRRDDGAPDQAAGHRQCQQRHSRGGHSRI